MKRSELPYLDDLRAFDAAARRSSVRAAADELSLTHAAVSRRIGRLAETVGAPLFERAGRGLRLTSAGIELRDACRRSFDDLGRTIASIRKAKGPDDGAILLSCERSIAMRWLIPRLSTFEDANAEVAVHLSVGGGALDARGDRVTLALRRLDFAVGTEWSVLPLFRESVGPVMVPSMRETFEAGHYTALCAATRPTAWDNWLSARPDVSSPHERRTFDHHFLMVEAAASGLGVAMSPRVLATDDIGRGRLVAPLGFVRDGSDYGLLHLRDVPPGDKAQRFVDWMREIAKEMAAAS